MIINENGKIRVFFGNGTLRVHCMKVKIENNFEGVGLFIFEKMPYCEPGTRTNDDLNLDNSDIAFLFETKEDLKVLKEAIVFMENLM